MLKFKKCTNLNCENPLKNKNGELPVSEFHSRKQKNSIGIYHNCKKCWRLVSKKNNDNNPSVIKKRKIRKEFLSSKLKACSNNNCSNPLKDKNGKLSFDQFYLRKNRGVGIIPKCKDCSKKEKTIQWHSNPLVRLKAYENKNERYRVDINYKISCRLRIRLGRAITDQSADKKVGSLEGLGMSILNVKKYLESKWLPGMTWENYGFGEDRWGIDHIIPLSKFDLTNQGCQKWANHYTNLKPMWHIDNISKGRKILYEKIK